MSVGLGHGVDMCKDKDLGIWNETEALRSWPSAVEQYEATRDDHKEFRVHTNNAQPRSLSNSFLEKAPMSSISTLQLETISF